MFLSPFVVYCSWWTVNIILTAQMAASAGEDNRVSFEEKGKASFKQNQGDERKEKFPETLSGFGYRFNDAGQLRKIDPKTNELTDEPFEFNVSDSHMYNQRRYEALGDVINQYVYDVMEVDMKMHKLDVPQGEDFLKKTFIYGTEDCFYNNDRLLILLQGSGVVRAGQWARSVIINEGLENGSMFPYINNARAQGYAVLVLNPNESKREYEGKTYTIKHSQNPIEHFNYVWKTYIKTAKARHIAIVAHSYGGVVCVDAAQNFYSDFNQRVFAIAMTDSAHMSLKMHKLSSKVSSYLQKVSRNWVADSTPLDTPVKTPSSEIPCVSAGTTSHTMTSGIAIKSVFAFLEDRYKKVASKQEL